MHTLNPITLHTQLNQKQCNPFNWIDLSGFWWTAKKIKIVNSQLGYFCYFKR